MDIFIIWIVFLLIILVNLITFFISKKITNLEKIIIDLFKKRNNQVLTIYSISWNTLNKKEEIFKNFFELKRRDFWESYSELNLENRIEIYKKIHNEINFIFEVCEKHPKISVDPFYIYIKESILEKSEEIWIYYNLHKKLKNIFRISKIFANITIIWLFIK